ncbi:MAG TPA: Dabb family protein [Actinomycetales bacterium]|nr:Dabb family protein [Actinomycetales bacterium]
MVLSLRQELDRIGPERFTARDHRPGVIRHVVLFRYRDDVTPEQKQEVLRRFLLLADSPRPDGGTYVLSIEAGPQGSGEDAGHGFEHGVVVSFASEGDRNYYVGEPVVDDPRFFDAEHAAFKRFVGPLLDEGSPGLLVFDVVTPGRGLGVLDAGTG